MVKINYQTNILKMKVHFVQFVTAKYNSKWCQYGNRCANISGTAKTDQLDYSI